MTEYAGLRRFFFALISGLLLLTGVPGPGTVPAGAAIDPVVLETVTVEGKNGARTFTVEIADDDDSRRTGLMFRRSMAEDHGMLFLFEEEAPRSFWMRNTYIPLDIIYINAEGSIVSIAEMAEPLSDRSLPSAGPAAAVLEINGGLSRTLGLGPGDKVTHPFFDR